MPALLIKSPNVKNKNHETNENCKQKRAFSLSKNYHYPTFYRKNYKIKKLERELLYKKLFNIYRRISPASGRKYGSNMTVENRVFISPGTGRSWSESSWGLACPGPSWSFCPNTSPAVSAPAQTHHPPPDEKKSRRPTQRVVYFKQCCRFSRLGRLSLKLNSNQQLTVVLYSEVLGSPDWSMPVSEP